MLRPLVLCLGVLLCACSRHSSPLNSRESSPASPVPAAAPSATTASGVSAKPARPAPGALGPEQAGGLAFEAPAPLLRRAPSSSMRAAEYVLEGAPEAPLTVFFFPGKGGSVDDNVARWAGQLRQPDGSDSRQRAEVTQREASGVKITRIELRGEYGGGMAMPGRPPPKVIADALLLGAIAQGPQGLVFFKWVGPAAALSAHEDAFDILLASLHPAAGG